MKHLSAFHLPFSHLSSYIYHHYQSSHYRKLKYDKNSIQLTTAFSIIFLYLIYLIIAQLSFSPTLTILFSFAFTSVFILLGSRIITQFDSVLIAFLSISSPVIVSHFQSNVFISFVVISLGPVFTLLLTNSYKCFAASTVLHLIDINTKFRENLLSRLYIVECHEHELFINQAFATLSVQIILSMLIYGFMDRVSQKCIVENTEKDHSLQETKLNNFKLLEDVCAQITHPLKYLYGIIDFAVPQIRSLQVIDAFKQIQTTLKVFKNDMDNLLVYEKLKFEEVDIQPIPTRTYDWLSEIWTISSDLIRDKGASGLLKVQRKVPSLLYLDSRRVQQVILNLLQFTLEHTKKGLINLTIEWLDSESVTDRCFEPIPYNYEEEGVFEKKEALHIFDIGNQDKTLDRFQIFKNQEREIKFEHCNFSQKIPFGTLKLTVRNNGAGLSEKEIEELFIEEVENTPVNQDETRLEDTDNGKIKKRPLKISRDICTRMDGDLRAYSRKDVGMTFMACFPIPMYQSWQVQSGIRAKVTKLRKIKPKALVGNNDPGLTSQITHYLKSLDGYIVNKATSVSEFFVTLAELSLESQRPFELVIVDMNLPHLDVVAFCERLRNVERKSQLGSLSILLTGDGEVNDVIQSLLNKNHPGYVNRYLKKPFEFYEFLDAILHIC